MRLAGVELQALRFPMSPITGAMVLEPIAVVNGVDAARAVERLFQGQHKSYEWQIRTPLNPYWQHYVLDCRGVE